MSDYGNVSPRTLAYVMNRRRTVFSPCRTYRYTLWRQWGEGSGFVMFIGLNPSTADETVDDPTIRRCAAFAKSWGYAGLFMLNLFAYRATQPADMKAAADPVGPLNDACLKAVASRAGMVVAAWGAHGSHLDRAEAVKQMIPGLHYLRLAREGHPGHPLYLPKDLQPIPFAGGEHGD